MSVEHIVDKLIRYSEQCNHYEDVQEVSEVHNTEENMNPVLYSEVQDSTFGYCKNKPYSVKEIDPNGINQHDVGAKCDAGKPDLSLLLLFGRALMAVGSVGTFGAKKYTRGGWQEVPDGKNRYTAALLRHLMYEGEGEEIDRDSGLHHAAHAAWNALARLEFILREEER